MRSVAIVLLIVAHAMHHVSVTKTEEQATIQQAEQSAPLVLTPELLSELRLLLTQTIVSEEHQETPQLTETSSVTPIDKQGKEESQTPGESVLLSVSQEERNKVIAAYNQGIPRREICSYLKWGSSRYSTIVKPALDCYEQQAGTREEQQQ